MPVQAWTRSESPSPWGPDVQRVRATPARRERCHGLRPPNQHLEDDGKSVDRLSYHASEVAGRRLARREAEDGRVPRRGQPGPSDDGKSADSFSCHASEAAGQALARSNAEDGGSSEGGQLDPGDDGKSSDSFRYLASEVANQSEATKRLVRKEGRRGGGTEKHGISPAPEVQDEPQTQPRRTQYTPKTHQDKPTDASYFLNAFFGSISALLLP